MVTGNSEVTNVMTLSLTFAQNDDVVTYIREKFKFKNF